MSLSFSRNVKPITNTNSLNSGLYQRTSVTNPFNTNSYLSSLPSSSSASSYSTISDSTFIAYVQQYPERLIRYLETNPHVLHPIHEKTRQDCRNFCYFLLTLLAIGLVLTLILLIVLTKTDNKTINISNALGSDISIWNDPQADCCNVFTTSALAIGLSLGYRSFCNTIAPRCVPATQVYPHTVSDYYSTSTNASIFPIVVTGQCFWGNITAVAITDPLNKYGMPYIWYQAGFTFHNLVFTNALNVTFYDAVTEEFITQNGLFACDGIVQRAQAATPNYHYIIEPPSSVAEASLDN